MASGMNDRSTASFEPYHGQNGRADSTAIPPNTSAGNANLPHLMDNW